MATPTESFDLPFRSRIAEASGIVSDVWGNLFRSVYDRLYPLGIERSFTIVNNTAVAADVTGLKVNSRGVSQAIVEFLVQRVTTGSGAVELIESGSFILSYNPTANDWNISLTHINAPDNSGVDFTVTSTGQVQYTSSNEGGTASISRLIWRMRTLAGKSEQYSSQGAR